MWNILHVSSAEFRAPPLFIDLFLLCFHHVYVLGQARVLIKPSRALENTAVSRKAFPLTPIPVSQRAKGCRGIWWGRWERKQHLQSISRPMSFVGGGEEGRPQNSFSTLWTPWSINKSPPLSFLWSFNLLVTGMLIVPYLWKQLFSPFKNNRHYIKFATPKRLYNRTVTCVINLKPLIDLHRKQPNLYSIVRSAAQWQPDSIIHRLPDLGNSREPGWLYQQQP